MFKSRLQKYGKFLIDNAIEIKKSSAPPLQGLEPLEKKDG